LGQELIEETVGLPNIRQQIVGPLGDRSILSGLLGDDVGIYIQASDGREVTVTKRKLRERYLLETGTRLERRAKVIAWLKGQIVAALGAEQVVEEMVEADFDEGDGTPLKLETRSSEGV
jgi:hypothetical protein